MPKERTEEQILAREPLTLQLGGEKYQVPVLAILKARAWRDKLIATAKEISMLGVSLSGIGAAFVVFPDKIAELLFAYSPDLAKHKKKILNSATEEELVLAFSTIVSVSFPFLRQLSLMKSVLSLPASEKSTNLSSLNTGSLPTM